MKTILLIDGSEEDYHLTKVACQRSGIPHHFRRVADDRVAIEYLSGGGEFYDRKRSPPPDIIFLNKDLFMLVGTQVMEWLRSRPSFAGLPVVILTGSTGRADVQEAYSHGITSYIEKDTDFPSFSRSVEVILCYWLKINISRNDSEVPPSKNSASIAA